MADYTYGIQNVWKEDIDFQTEALSGIVKHIRRVDNPEICKLQFEYLKNIGAFYVPRGEYLIDRFGEDITDIQKGIFTAYGMCFLQERLAIPMRLADGTVTGFVGYSNKPSDWPEEQAFIKYGYPPKVAFAKGRYFFIEPDELERALTEQYICIVDGLFDKMMLQCLGINAVSLCGSALTEWHIMYLKFIKHVIVVGDNDLAGRKLYNICKWKLNNVVEIRQPYTGDIDDYLKTPERIAEFQRVFAEMKSEDFLISKEIKENI